MYFREGEDTIFHVVSPKVLTLGSPERREIVNYVSGKNLNFKYFFREVAMGMGEFGIGSKTFKGIKNVPVKCMLLG